MHPKVGRWLQFGGHIESIDDSFAAAALRECQEESGYTEIALMDVPVQLDRHDVPCAGNQSVHWDIQFIALVNKASARSEGEDLQTRWWSVDTLGDELPDLDPSVRKLVAKALQITVP
jgi:8-oxo-dGTP pyrophosphatase MutT (NUDIX family)